MRSWMLRGLVYAAAMVVVRLVQGALINAWQTQAGLFSVVLLILFVIGVIVWGVADGRADANDNPDPDRRRDLAMTWLLAGLVAGILSGAVAWLIALAYNGLYTGGLINELTTFAAFTALLVFVPAIIGVTLGRWRVDRRRPEAARKDKGDDRADTDVFAAARGDEARAGDTEAGSAHARTEERTTPVATAEREGPTESIPTADDDARTEVIRTDTPRHTRPESERE